MSLFGLLPQGMTNLPMPNVQTMAPEEEVYTPKPIGLLGALGLKGPARDFLGQLGDALLTANGEDPLYANAKRKNEMDFAMRGFADDPMGAIKRVSAIDPQAGRALQNDYMKNMQDQQKALLEQRNDTMDLRGKVLGQIGAFMNGSNEATWGPMRMKALEMAKRNGFDLGDFIPEAYSEDAKTSFVNSTMKPKDIFDMENDRWYKQERLNDYDMAEQRQIRNTDSQINRRNVQNEMDRVNSYRQVANTGSQIASRAVRDGVAVQNAKTKAAKANAPKIEKIKASKVPSSARLGRKDGKRVAQFGGKIYYVED